MHYDKFPDGTVKCIENEIPFDIPSTWSWTRIGVISIINPKNNIDDNMSVSFVPMTLVADQFTNKHTTETKKWSEVKSGFTHFREKDIGLAKITPCFENRKSVILRNLENGYGAGTTELHIIRPINSDIANEYLLWFVKSELFIQNGKQAFSGAVGQQRIGKEYVTNSLLPLPSCAEQNRIVSAISLAFEQISIIENEKTDLQSVAIQAKSKILDLAIHGKLVPQDENDEPASVLLERIRNEKKKQLGKKYVDNYIYQSDDKSYYADNGESYPNGWAETTLAMLTTPQTLNDGDWILTDDMSDNGTVKLIQLGSIGNTKYINKGFKYLSVEKFDELHCTVILPGYLLINRLIGDRLNCCVLPPIEGTLITAVDICWIAPMESKYDISYLMYCMSAEIFQQKAFTVSSGSTRKRISKGNLIQLSIPFPPLLEQHRIVSEIEKAFEQIDKITEALA